MTLQHFTILPKEEQIDVIKRDGSFLYVRNLGGIDIILYQVEGFYAEVLFDESKGNKVTIRGFDDLSSLDVYLNDINISAIQKLL